MPVSGPLQEAGYWAIYQGLRKWARQDLNLRPLACEASALPLSYAPGSRHDSTRFSGQMTGNLAKRRRRRVPASRRRHRRASQLGPAKFGTRYGAAQDPDSPPDQARPVFQAPSFLTPLWWKDGGHEDHRHRLRAMRRHHARVGWPVRGLRGRAHPPPTGGPHAPGPRWQRPATSQARRLSPQRSGAEQPRGQTRSTPRPEPSLPAVGLLRWSAARLRPRSG
jgi:hypothetical protein